MVYGLPVCGSRYCAVLDPECTSPVQYGMKSMLQSRTGLRASVTSKMPCMRETSSPGSSSAL
jgi:hypothetical protein